MSNYTLSLQDRLEKLETNILNPVGYIPVIGISSAVVRLALGTIQLVGTTASIILTAGYASENYYISQHWMHGLGNITRAFFTAIPLLNLLTLCYDNVEIFPYTGKYSSSLPIYVNTRAIKFYKSCLQEAKRTKQDDLVKLMQKNIGRIKGNLLARMDYMMKNQQYTYSNLYESFSYLEDSINFIDSTPSRISYDYQYPASNTRHIIAPIYPGVAAQRKKAVVVAPSKEGNVVKAKKKKKEVVLQREGDACSESSSQPGLTSSMYPSAPKYQEQ